jgi:N-acetylneuraminic acid mutarotase
VIFIVPIEARYDVHIYHEPTASWTAGKNPLFRVERRFDTDKLSGTCVIDNKIYVFGGKSNYSPDLVPQNWRFIEVYDPNNDTWAQEPLVTEVIGLMGFKRCAIVNGVNYILDRRVVVQLGKVPTTEYTDALNNNAHLYQFTP